MKFSVHGRKAALKPPFCRLSGARGESSTLRAVTMRTAAVIASLIICCGIAPPSGQAARLIPPPRAKLASYDWSVKASPNLARNPPSKRIVEAFVRSIEVSVYGLSSIGDREGGDEI